jgi:nitroreductase
VRADRPGRDVTKIREAHDAQRATRATSGRGPAVPPTSTDAAQGGWACTLLDAGIAAMHEQLGRNYAFFDAPVGLIFTIDRVMQQGSWLDYGMFLQSLMVAARARGLGTCPQAAFTQFHRIIEAQLGLLPSEMVVCGMSLGHADPSAVENSLITEREPVQGFTRFHD